MRNLDSKVQQWECCINCLLVFNCLTIVFLVQVVLLREEVLRIQRFGGWEGVRRGVVAGRTIIKQTYLVSVVVNVVVNVILVPVGLAFQGR